MIQAAVQTQRITVFKDLFEDQGSPSWSSSITTCLISSLIICLPRGLVSCHTFKGSQVPSHLVLVYKSVLLLSQHSDVTDLVPSRLVLIALMLSHKSSPHHNLPKSGIWL